MFIILDCLSLSGCFGEEKRGVGRDGFWNCSRVSVVGSGAGAGAGMGFERLVVFLASKLVGGL